MTNVAFRMAIDDVFEITGRGIACIGTIEKGLIRVGDIVKLKRRNGTVIKVQVKGIEQSRKLLDDARAGETVGLLLGWCEVTRGDILEI